MSTANQPDAAKVAATSGHPSNGVRKGERRGGRQAGTPNKATVDVRELAKLHGPAAIRRAAELAGLVNNGKSKAESEQAQLTAIGIILDRAYGKAPQAIVGEDGEGPVKHVMEIVWGSTNGFNGHG